MDGVGTILHCAGSAKGDEEKTRNLVRAASRAGVQHLVYISVVGAERVPVVSGVDRAMFGYFASKRAAEKVIAESGLPWTTLRATQFHDAMLAVVRQLAKLPVIPVSAGFRFQPVDAAEVAARLVELALGKPSGLVPDLAGPRIYGMDEMLHIYLRASHRHRLLLPVRLPARLLAPTGPARTWRPNGPSAIEAGRTSSPIGCVSAPDYLKGDQLPEFSTVTTPTQAGEPPYPWSELPRIDRHVVRAQPQTGVAQLAGGAALRWPTVRVRIPSPVPRPPRRRDRGGAWRRGRWL